MSEWARVVALLPITSDVVDGVADVPAFARVNNLDPGTDVSLVRLVVHQSEAFRQRIGAPVEWCGHLAIDATTRQVVGTCSFKGAPADGEVEVSYFTFPEYEGRGYGTAMCRALVERAELAGVVRVIAALTLSEEGASSRILARNGFSLHGTVIDPEDGTVFRWERPVAR